MKLNEINSGVWTPEIWLRYATQQTIKGAVKMKSMAIEELETTSGDATFQSKGSKKKRYFNAYFDNLHSFRPTRQKWKPTFIW